MGDGRHAARPMPRQSVIDCELTLQHFAGPRGENSLRALRSLQMQSKQANPRDSSSPLRSMPMSGGMAPASAMYLS